MDTMSAILSNNTLFILILSIHGLRGISSAMLSGRVALYLYGEQLGCCQAS